MKSLISAVIPCYNEETNIVKVLKDADRALNHICRNYEIIVVDDGSNDQSLELMEKLAEDNKHIRIVTHQKNKGYGAAIMSGISAAQGDIIIMVDGDGQFDLREFSYITKGLKYADVVIGYRIKRRDPFIRRLNSLIFNWAVRVFFGLWVKDLNCSMKGFRREVVEQLDIISQGALINADILTQTMRRGFKVVQVPIHHFPRVSGIPTGGNFGVIMRSFFEYSRLFIREFPLRWKEFTFRQRTTIGFIFAVLILFFSQPVFGWHFITGIAVSLSGLVMRNWAGGHLNKSKELACTGPYAYVRHPLYMGSLLLGIGFCLMASNIDHPVVTGVFWMLFLSFFIGVYRLKILDEEKNLKKLFKKDYDDYASYVPRYIPVKIKYNGRNQLFNWVFWKKNKEYNSIIGFSIALILIIIKLGK